MIECMLGVQMVLVLFVNFTDMKSIKVTDTLLSYNKN